MSFEKPGSGILHQQGFSIDHFSKTVVCAKGPAITNVRFRSDVTQTPQPKERLLENHFFEPPFFWTSDQFPELHRDPWKAICADFCFVE